MGKFKNILIASVAVTSLIGAVVPSVFANSESPVTFTDVPEGSSHYDAIYTLVNDGIITGYPDKTFKPNDKLSRANAAVLFSNTFGLILPGKSTVTDYFSDVSATHPYAAEIAAVYEAGIFKGANGAFQINSQLTREAMASTLVNAFLLEGTGEDIDVNLDNVSDTHKENVKILAQLGITNQLADFHPKDPVTRGQFATFLDKSMKASDFEFIAEEIYPFAVADETTKELYVLALLRTYNEGDVGTISVYGYDENGNVAEEPVFIGEDIEIVDNVVEAIFDASNLKYGDYLAEITVGDVTTEMELAIEFTEVDQVVNAVNTADTEEQLLTALDNDYFYDVDPNLIAEYRAELGADTTAFDLAVEIQTIIDEINER
ncbi:S-layer homology domain-containing protein [Aquibacillus albus]|uniref:SLH domain-containing protein n=1 Tax=Aquibacillus albus TaxID=1168171 RepID=A0ABS2N5S4_9BACI|nr:S-layer homology domain-containing protein [Aquibacillus albus]MBM7573477.1 hypothetical protein [Aquibacillus albus]